MRLIATELPEVLLMEPVVHRDDRGFFLESFNARQFEDLTGIAPIFVQDNHSGSSRGVLRGIHYQVRHAQGKLLRVVAGEVFDVAVDLRRESPLFGRWTGAVLSANNCRQMWVPAGFGHAFLTLSERAELLYKTTDYYAPEHDRCIRWDDEDLAIDWPLEGKPTLSAKDTAGSSFRNTDVYEGEQAGGHGGE